jgi:hypothetical protein
LRGVLQEAELRAGLEAGGCIVGVVIVAHRDEATGRLHVPYLLPSWRRGYVAIGLSRGGVRTFRDLDRLVRFLREDFRFDGGIVLHEEGSARLGRWRSLSRVANGGAARAGSRNSGEASG